MHGLGDLLMFVPTFNLLQQKKGYIDIIVFENNSISPIKNSPKIRNIYYLDDQERVRSSYQYHSETIGYLKIERIDR